MVIYVYGKLYTEEKYYFIHHSFQMTQNVMTNLKTVMLLCNNVCESTTLAVTCHMLV